MPDVIDDILGPDGAVARRLGDAYEPRPEQLAMARAVRDALSDEDPHHLLVEAGTGVGKSFAYLLPAIEFATRRADEKQPRKRVVISTHTISLQEQLIDKDIPLLASLYPDEFTAVLVKGRGNYLCRRRLESSLANRQMLFDDDRQIASLATINDWATTTGDGSLATLPQVPEPGVWDEVRAEHGNCLGKRCKHFEGCFWQSAKRRMMGGNLLIVNHALFFSDLALRSAGVNYLPKYDAVIFDEAHTIEDVAGQHFAIKLSEASLRYQLRQLYDLRKGKGALALHPPDVSGDAVSAVCDAQESADAFFDRVARWQQQHGRANGRVNRPDIVETDLAGRLNDAAKLIRAMLKHVKAPEVLLELGSKADRLATTAQTVEVLLKQTMPDAVYWVELTRRPAGRGGGTTQRVTLSAAPVDVSAGLRQQLFDRTPRVVMTSATLCTGRATTERADRGTGLRHVLDQRTVQIRKGANLPHWTTDGGIYAVTCRLADSLPIAAALELDQRRGMISSVAVDEWLDRALGECWLSRQDVADVVSESLQHGDGVRYQLLAWSVMPNHVHLVMRPLGGNDLDEILSSFKRFTATRANKLIGRSGPFWQSESYDHLVRDADDLRNQAIYAYENPAKSGVDGDRCRFIDVDGIEALTGGAGGVQKPRLHVPEARATPSSADPVHPAFAYIARRLGVADSTRTLQLGSPFDYAAQATLYVEAGLPDPGDTLRFMPAACERIEHYVRHTHGGAFVLFTSFAMLRDAAQRLRATFEHLGLPVLVQGVDGPPRQLLARFRELDDAVLFGTTSFWQGIDVQGSRLRNVIIAKLPFAVPDEPLVEAKLEDVARRGGNAFMDLTLPEAIIRFKQGFGRLIRSRTDKGIVVVLDPRVKTKRYGRQFLDALPDVRVVEVRQ